MNSDYTTNTTDEKSMSGTLKDSQNNTITAMSSAGDSVYSQPHHMSPYTTYVPAPDLTNGTLGFHPGVIGNRNFSTAPRSRSKSRSSSGQYYKSYFSLYLKVFI